MIFGITPFAELSPAAVAGLVLIYFLAFFIRGVVGFGSVTPAVLFSAWILPPHYAVVLAMAASVYAQVQLLPQGLVKADWRIAWPVIAGGVVAIAVGVWIFANLKAAWLTVAMGGLLGCTVLVDMLRLPEHLARRLDLRAFRVPFGLSVIGGLVSGIAGGGMIYFLSMYTKWACPTPAVFRATNILISAFSNVWRAVLMLAGGLMTFAILIEAALLMPAVFLGGWAGGRLARWLPAARFFRFFQVLLFLAAVSLVWKGVRDLS